MTIRRLSYPTERPLWNRRLTLDLLQQEATERISASASVDAFEPLTHTRPMRRRRDSLTM